MDYALQVLKKEKGIIDSCLSVGDWDKYPEAKKRQNRKSNDLNRAIIKLKNGI